MNYTLKHGAHDTREEGMCLLEAVAYIAGEPHSDAPACACDVLAKYGRSLNDAMGDGAEGDALRDKHLAEVAPLLVDTRGTRDVQRRRAYLLADRAVRLIAPLALDAAGLHDHAATLRGLAPVTDAATARAARGVADAAAKAAWSAAGAAYFAAGAAAAEAADAADAAAGAAAGAAYFAAGAARNAARAADPDAVWTAARQALIDAINVGNTDTDNTGGM